MDVDYLEIHQFLRVGNLIRFEGRGRSVAGLEIWGNKVNWWIGGEGKRFISRYLKFRDIFDYNHPKRSFILRYLQIMGPSFFFAVTTVVIIIRLA